MLGSLTRAAQMQYRMRGDLLFFGVGFLMLTQADNKFHHRLRARLINSGLWHDNLLKSTALHP
jgi:hypothetical protein